MLLHLSGHRSKFRAVCLPCYNTVTGLVEMQERDTKLVKLSQVEQGLHRNNEVAINTNLVTRKSKYSSEGSPFFSENQTMHHCI